MPEINLLSKNNYIFIMISIILVLYSIFIQYRYLGYFFPNKIIKSKPSDFNLEYEEINIGKINGWLFKSIKTLDQKQQLNTLPASTQTKLIIFCHGNAGNISNRIWIIKQLLEIFPNTDIFIYDYPQFGLSRGDLSLSNVIKSSYGVYNHWSNKYSHINLLGESIGAGVIAELFKLLIKLKHTNMPKMIIHLNGLTSLHKTINSILPFTIKPFILPWINELDCETIYWNNISKLPKLLIIHALNDEIINIDLVHDLIKKLSYSENVHFIKIDGSHNQPIIDTKCIKKIKNIYETN
jgi:hypothetical protein